MLRRSLHVDDAPPGCHGGVSSPPHTHHHHHRVCVRGPVCVAAGSFWCLRPPQLSQLRGRDRTFTLLHALVEQVMLHQPGLAAFTQELAEFHAVPAGRCRPRLNLRLNRSRSLPSS